MKKLNKVRKDINIDDLYEKAITPMNEDPNRYDYHYKNCIIHLVDSVSRGYTTKLEAYDALKQPYFPEYLKVRKSLYMDLV